MSASSSSRLKDAQRHFSQLQSRNARHWRRAVNEELKPHGLTEATWLPLLHLARAGEPMLQKDLAQSLTLDGSSVVRLIDALEASGHVVRTATDDRRAKAIRLTPLGKRTAAKAEAASDHARSRFLAGVTLEELETANAVLEKVAAALKAAEQAETA